MREKRWNPTRYLGINLWNGNLVFTSDIIGILPYQIKNILAYKKGYTVVLGKSNEIIERKMISIEKSIEGLM